MRRFVNILFVFIVVPLVVVVAYCVIDPFKVVRHYDSYIESGKPIVVVSNKDYVSTSTFDNNYDVYKYDSYILGNSRASFYEVATWRKYLSESSSCYHFDAFRDNLYGIYKKVLYIDRCGADINNVLLVLDHGTLSGIEPREGVLFMVAPQLEDYDNIVDFHLTAFVASLNFRFLSTMILYLMTGRYGDMMDDRVFTYDLGSNEVRFEGMESDIEGKPSEFYNEERMVEFYYRDVVQQYEDPVIGSSQLEMLCEIKRIFDKHNTDYKVVISPLYDQKKLDVSDIYAISNVFGMNNLYDFSGINRFTEDYRNYYEHSHYRPHVSAEIMDIVYTNDSLRLVNIY